VTAAPKVFVSHASEDKARFVLGFAERLRAAGIDAWLDRWEMLPGDSVVDRIFEEGLAEAGAVVVVLSVHSVDKPWVREELNAAFVKRVAGRTKLIPVLLDDCRVPEALAATLWERIDDVASYDESFLRIVAAITGVRDKPALGQLPAYATAPLAAISGLAPLDARVMAALGDCVLRQGHEHVDGDELAALPQLAGLPAGEIADALAVLADAALIVPDHHGGPGLPLVRVTTLGLQQYAKAYLPGYDALLRALAGAIVNEGLDTNEALAARLAQPRVLVDHALEVLEADGLLRVQRYGSGLADIHDVSVRLRRSLA
jgi:hypothetical protein